MRAGGGVWKIDGLQSLEDYAAIYLDQWKSTVLGGISPDSLENLRNDRLFAMERLNGNPFSIHRVKSDDVLPFTISDDDVANITKSDGESLAPIRREIIYCGSLFLQ